MAATELNPREGTRAARAWIQGTESQGTVKKGILAEGKVVMKDCLAVQDMDSQAQKTPRAGQAPAGDAPGGGGPGGGPPGCPGCEFAGAEEP